MKKVMKGCLVIILVACASHIASAQIELAVGIKGGPNFAKINTEASATENYKSRTGFHAGAFVLIKATKIGVQPELIFSQQGSKVRINDQDYESNFSYINIPVMIKLYTVAGINIQAGPQFGFVNSAEAPVVSGATSSTWTVEDVKDRTKKSDLTLGLGLGWDLPFGLTLDARYNLGLSKIYENAPSSQTKDAKNQVIQFSLGYKLFKLGK